MNVTIRDLMTNSDLFGDQFGGESWLAWLALLCGFYGLELTPEEQRIFEKLTKRKSALQALLELWMTFGRRSGKSNAGAALLAIYESCFIDHRDKLSPGEVATVRVMAADKAQARSVMRYITGLLESNPMLMRMVVKMGRESIELNNRCVVEVGTASFRSARGYTFAAVICDELAFWRSDDSANPDVEILNAVRPGLATLNGKLIVLSSPYAKRGELWTTYQRYYGKPGNILVAQAASRVMNPTLPQRIIDEAMERDSSVAKAEYLAEFRSDLETFLLREIVDAAVRAGPLELPFDKAHKYFSFTDPAGGSADEFTLAIGHKEADCTVVDLVRGRRGVPAAIVAEYAQTLSDYGIRKVSGDRYAGSWPGDEFKKHNIEYNPSEKPKSGLYLDLLPSLNSGRVELPPDDKLVNQLIGLERRTSRAGKDSIDHPPSGHDDRANVIAGLVSTKAASAYDLELLVTGRRASDEKPNHSHSRRSPIEALKAAGIPLN